MATAHRFISRRRLLANALLTCVAVVAAMAVAPAQAQSLAGKTIRIIVPYAPGGTSDILARALSGEVGKALGATVVVDNKPGANGVLGSDLVAKSAPDGTTLLLTDVSGLTSAPALGAKMPFDPAKDLAPITMITYSPHLLVVNPGVAAKTLPELVAASKAKAGGFSAATVGAGSAPHLAGVAVESTFNWYWLVDGLQAAGYPMRLVNTTASDSTRSMRSQLPVCGNVSLGTCSFRGKCSSRVFVHFWKPMRTTSQRVPSLRRA